jgi:hypothetical protein
MRAPGRLAGARDRLARNKLALIGSLVALACVLVGIVGPFVAPYDYAT